MKNISKNVVFGIVILVLSLLPFLWLRGGYVYMSEEDNFGNYKNVLYRNAYSWTTSVNKGNPVLSNDHVVIIPAGIMYQIFSDLGIPNDVTQKFYLSAIMCITFIAVAYALRIFTTHRMILLTGVFFYYFNFYVKSTTYYSAKMYQLILMPLFFAFLYNYLKSGKYYYVAINFLVFFVFQAIFTNLATFLATIVFYPVAVLYHYSAQRMHIFAYMKQYTRALIIFFLPTVPIFFYNWLLYYFSYVSNNTYAAVKQSQTFSAIAASLNAILQFRGAWWETAGFEGVSYNPWLWYYDNPMIVLSSFALVAGMFWYVVYKKNVSRTYFFWFSIFIIGVLLASGSSFYQPLYKWLFINIPLFYIFREPWAKFMPIVIFSATVMLVLSLRDFKKKYILYGVIVLILLRGLPFFTPDFFDYHSKRGYMPFAKIPSYWKQYEAWTLQNRDATILSIPVDYFLRNWYKEDVGNINHPLTRLFGYSPIIYEINNNNFGSMLHYFVQHQNPSIIKVANIDYAFTQADIDTRGHSEKSKNFSKLLKNYFQNIPSRSFGGKLFLHRIKPEYFSPLIYIPHRLITTGGLSSFANILSNDAYQLDTAVFLKSQNRDKMYILNDIITRAPTKKVRAAVQFKKIDPTKYVVTLKNVDGITPLIFNQNYHPDWKIFIHTRDTSQNGQIIQYFFPQPLSPNHFTANGYANAWFINPHTICAQYNSCTRNADGTYSIDIMIEYWPNRLFVLGLMFFSITSIGVLIILFITQLKRKV